MRRRSVTVMTKYIAVCIFVGWAAAPLCTAYAADNPAAPAAETVKADAKTVAAVVKRDAKSVSAAAKSGARQVAVAARDFGHEVATAAKHAAKKVKTAVKPEKSGQAAD